MSITFDTFNENIADGMLKAGDAAGGLTSFLQFRHIELTAGRLVAEFDARDELKTPFGNLHGGCLSAFVDHCLGTVFYPVIPAGAWVATTEFKLNLTRPVNDGVVSAVTEIIALGGRTGVASIRMTNNDKLVCAAQGTVSIVKPKA